MAEQRISPDGFQRQTDRQTYVLTGRNNGRRGGWKEGGRKGRKVNGALRNQVRFCSV